MHLPTTVTCKTFLVWRLLGLHTSKTLPIVLLITKFATLTRLQVYTKEAIVKQTLTYYGLLALGDGGLTPAESPPSPE